jgi:hypothetical protein
VAEGHTSLSSPKLLNCELTNFVVEFIIKTMNTLNDEKESPYKAIKFAGYEQDLYEKETSGNDPYSGMRT